MTMWSLARRRPRPSARETRLSSRERAVHRRPTRAACRSSPAPCPNPWCSRALPGERVPLDFLVQVRPWHVEGSRRLAHVPVVLAQLREQERALRGLLELLEGLALEQRPDA